MKLVKGGVKLMKLVKGGVKFMKLVKGGVKFMKLVKGGASYKYLEPLAQTVLSSTRVTSSPVSEAVFESDRTNFVSDISHTAIKPHSLCSLKQRK
jgi:hypothetical protein